MKRSLLVLFLAALICFAGFAAPAQAHEDVTPQQAKNMIDSNNPPIVVDVREPDEYCDPPGHIPGALNYPWMSGVLEQQYGQLPVDSNILVYCLSGYRGNLASAFLDSQGFLYVHDLLGGILAWEWETTECVDSDSDDINDDLDNCPAVYNPSQTDSDGDGTGNVCDGDCPWLDGAEPVNFADFAILMQNWLRTGPGLAGDLDQNEMVDANDLALLGSYWLTTCHE